MARRGVAMFTAFHLPHSSRIGGYGRQDKEQENENSQVPNEWIRASLAIHSIVGKQVAATTDTNKELWECPSLAFGLQG